LTTLPKIQNPIEKAKLRQSQFWLTLSLFSR